jgi:hypothetical protein
VAGHWDDGTVDVLVLGGQDASARDSRTTVFRYDPSTIVPATTGVPTTGVPATAGVPTTTAVVSPAVVSSPNADNGADGSIFIIIGIAAGACCLLVVVALAVFFVRRRRKDSNSLAAPEPVELTTPNYGGMPASPRDQSYSAMPGAPSGSPPVGYDASPFAPDSLTSPADDHKTLISDRMGRDDKYLLDSADIKVRLRSDKFVCIGRLTVTRVTAFPVCSSARRSARARSELSIAANGEVRDLM